MESSRVESRAKDLSCVDLGERRQDHGQSLAVLEVPIGVRRCGSGVVAKQVVFMVSAGYEGATAYGLITMTPEIHKIIGMKKKTPSRR